MKILAVNCGSSSLKFKMYEMPEEEVLISGLFERIGEKMSSYTIKLKDNFCNNMIVNIIYILLYITCIIFLASLTYNPFIYFRFWLLLKQYN